jgi:CRP-like cAMP-binding protein
MESEKGAKRQTGAADRLNGIELLDGLPAAELDALSARATFQRYSAGAQILSREAGGCDVLFVIKGSLRVVSFSVSGREVAYAVVQAGGYIGELSAIDGEARSASGVALEDCLIASLPAEVFRELLTRHAFIALRVTEKLVRIIREGNERIMDLATLGAYQRVYREILKRARPDPLRADSWLVYPLPTQVEIAAHASTTRETVARVISSLGQAEIVGRKGKTLYIRDRQRLEQLIERTDTGQGA